MEYAKYGEFFNYIVESTRLQEEEASMFYVQVLQGIEYIHKHKIVHRDLKPENLLLNENKTLKLIDFGLSNSYEKGNVLKTPCGSPCYAAPEMLIGKQYSGLEIDIWSSGIILYAMVCGYLPFEVESS
jgi:5'-AMP-activated protein kinase catalytic alpha subunit